MPQELIDIMAESEIDDSKDISSDDNRQYQLTVKSILLLMKIANLMMTIDNVCTLL